MDKSQLGGMGWMRDLPDFRDYTIETQEVKSILKESAPLKTVAKAIPDAEDLRSWCSPIEDQGMLGSCTAQAGVGLLEYFERRAFSHHLDASRMFLYKVTRNLMQLTGDTGATIRDTMKAMVLFGIPPEKYWEYYIPTFDDEPSAFCYAFAQNYQTIQYYRHDPPGTSPGTLLTSIKTYLAAKLPCIFGFAAFSSIPRRNEGTGDIPFPTLGDVFLGGHAVVTVGFNDKHKIAGDTGALLIRNSWGVEWGEAGYGWLPYKYIEAGLAVDFWSLVKTEFVNTDLFK
jgi:C1A family cysteine protease